MCTIFKAYAKQCATTFKLLDWKKLCIFSFITAIGFNCILTMSTKTVLSKLRGTTLALYILTLSRNSRFEFIFTNLAQSNARKYASVFDIYRCYQSTVLYRELKLRSAIMSSGQLKLLAKEQVYSTFAGIWNLSSDQGNLGTFIVTNVRLIWYADINETFNISLPHMQIASVSNHLSLRRTVSNGLVMVCISCKFKFKYRLKSETQNMAMR